MQIKKEEKRERVEPNVVSKFCLGMCDHEVKLDLETGRPYVKCWGCGREIGKMN